MSHFTVLVIGDNPEQLLAPYQQDNMGECSKEYLKFVEAENYSIDQETGKRGYWDNPNGKWDWYLLGGRWLGTFKLKDGATGVTGEGSWFKQDEEKGRADQAYKKDIDFSLIDEYITFAVIKEGKWYEEGEMGWWGIVIDPKDKELFIDPKDKELFIDPKDKELWSYEWKALVKDLPEDTLLSIYDCHT